jgi:serine/threonine protein kinase
MMGTMKYMAPEQWGIGVDIDHRTDVWAVGLILFKMLTGRHPLYPLRATSWWSPACSTSRCRACARPRPTCRARWPTWSTAA